MLNLLNQMTSRLKPTLTKMRPSQAQSSNLKPQKSNSKPLLSPPTTKFSSSRNVKHSLKRSTMMPTSSQPRKTKKLATKRTSSSQKLTWLQSRRSSTCRIWRRLSLTPTTEKTWSAWWTWASSTSRRTFNCSKSISTTLHWLCPMSWRNEPISHYIWYWNIWQAKTYLFDPYKTYYPKD